MVYLEDYLGQRVLEQFRFLGSHGPPFRLVRDEFNFSLFERLGSTGHNYLGPEYTTQGKREENSGWV
jgi:hypothetical protein